MIKDGIADKDRYALASLIVCTLDNKSIGGAAIGSDGERELMLLEQHIERVLDELNGDPVNLGFSYKTIGTLDLSHKISRFKNPELYFVPATPDYELREVRDDTTNLVIPDSVNVLFLYDIGAESFTTIRSALNYRPIYRDGILVAVGVGQDSTGFVPYAGVRSREQPSYRGLLLGLKEPPQLIHVMRKEGVLDTLITDVDYSKLKIPAEV